MKIETNNLIFDDSDPRCFYILDRTITPTNNNAILVIVSCFDKTTGHENVYYGIIDTPTVTENDVKNIMEIGGDVYKLKQKLNQFYNQPWFAFILHR